MTDGIIKGTGNSRYLKGPANALTLYPTHEDLMEALAQGTLPIDLNGINPAGWETVGDKLGKSTLLTDALCTALSLPTTATPTQAMDKLRQLVNTAQQGVDNGVKMQIVSYVGTGTYGINNPCSITFSFAPAVVLWIASQYMNSAFNPNFFTTSNWSALIISSLLGSGYTKYLGFCDMSNQNNSYARKSPEGKTIYWYNYRSEGSQINSMDTTYYFLAIA